MYTIGQHLAGYRYNDAGESVRVEGTFLFRTDDPEEFIQDIVLKTADGKVVYIDEQDIVKTM